MMTKNANKAAAAVATHLTLSWGVSRGRETDGYTICRVRDDSTGKVYRRMGGGYDLTGSAFGAWLQDVHADALVGISHRAYYLDALDGKSSCVMDSGLYGMRRSVKPGTLRPVHVYLDGACGLESMLRIAAELGLDVTREYNRKGNTTGWLVVSNA
jgi:hypothetical protein